MDIIVSGRHTYVPEAFRNTVSEKLAKVELLLPKVQTVEVEISHENNPKLDGARLRVQITVIGLGPVVRAEAAAHEALDAFDSAFEKLQERLRRSRDRAKSHHAKVDKVGPSFDAASLEQELQREAKLAKTVAKLEDVSHLSDPELLEAKLAIGETVEARLGDTPVTVRKKVHAGEHISIEEALERMELLGHDFYLFIHEKTGRPAVLYRRHGWKYGIIELEG